MGWEQDAHVAYDNQLRAAERHMEGHPVERKCVNCASFCEIADTLGLSAGLDRALSFCGACERDGALYVVDRSNTEDIDECFEEDETWS